MPFVVGVTGGIGAGKTTVTDLFEAQGVVVVDADLIAREVVLPGEPTLERIVQRYGEEILLDDKTLNRRKLREIIFNDDGERLWLESITHPAIRKLTEERLKHASSPYVIFSSPLLLETDQHLLADHIVAIDVPEETQVTRACSRDQQTEQQIRSIIAKQISRTERLARAQSIIDNSQSLSHTATQVQALHQTFTMQAKPHS